MPEVDPGRCGTVENALRKLSKLSDTRNARDNRFHQKKSLKRKLAKTAAVKRHKRKLDKEMQQKQQFHSTYRMTLAKQGRRVLSKRMSRRAKEKIKA